MSKLPAYYQATDSQNIYLPRYEAIAQAANLTKSQLPQRSSKAQTALFVIDAQIGFCHPKASLYVPGAEADMDRLAEFIYRNVSDLDALYFSFDTHSCFQIFFPAFWLNANQEHPAPFTIITAQEVAQGKWRAVREPEFALQYLRQLEATGKYQLCIWPYHTMMGSVDHALAPVLFESALFHAQATGRETFWQVKGRAPLTENYSVFAPEITKLITADTQLKVGSFNVELLNKLMRYDRIYIAGEASSHCVRFTIADLVQQLMSVDRSLLTKLYILQDCMSPVPAIPNVVDFPALATQALAEFAALGVNIVKSTDEI